MDIIDQATAWQLTRHERARQRRGETEYKRRACQYGAPRDNPYETCDARWIGFERARMDEQRLEEKR